MRKGKVEIQEGSILPAQRGLWNAAADKLTEARYGMHEMHSAADRIQFENGWTRLVDSLQEFWVRFLDEGKTN